MSAIFGLIDQEGVSESSLQAPLDACAVYGNDSTGLWIDGMVGLGARLSYFTPESFNETLPFHSDGLTIVADARLDNRAELLRALEVADPGIADSRLILHAYQRWGTECVAHLIGDFAFALWESRRQLLFCGRDPVGARPFYYYAPSPRYFAFATSLDSLLAFANVPAQIDEEMVADYLYNPIEMSPQQTFFEGIRKLPFAHHLCVSTQGIEQRRYWEPHPQPHLQLKRVEEYGEAVRERVEEAVACRIRTPLPTGAHVSGGLDSSSIAVIAQRLLKAQGRSLTMAYSWSPPPSQDDPLQPGRDEREIIEQLCRQEEIPLRFSDFTACDEHAYRRADIARMPVSARSAELPVLRDAQQRGIRTLLSGWGGDEGISFNGRGFYAWLLTSGRWWALQKQLLRGGFAPKSWARRVSNHLVMPFLPESLFLRMLSPARHHVPPSLMHPQLAARLDLQRQRKRIVATRDRTSPFATQAALFNHGHLTHRLEAWSSWGARYGVTYSYPLLDRRVLELAYAIPPQMNNSPAGSRLIFRRAMAGLLPDTVMNGRKEDAILEERTYHVIVALWRQLAQEAEQGSFDKDVPWLDMPRFRATLMQPSDLAQFAARMQFVRVSGALHGWDLWQRYCSR